MALETRGETLGAAQDVGRADGAVRGDGVLGLDLGDGCGLVDGDAECFDGVGEPFDEFGGVQAGAVRGPAGADGAGDADAFGGLARAAQDAFGLAEGDLDGVEVLEAGELGGGAGDLEDAAVVDVGVDVLVGGGADDFADGVVHGLLEAYGGVVAVEFRVAGAAGDAVVEPAAVAAGGAVAAELGFQDSDVEEGYCLLEVVRRPESGVAAADDADVCGGVAGQGFAGAGVPSCAYQNDMPPLTVLTVLMCPLLVRVQLSRESQRGRYCATGGFVVRWASRLGV